MMIFLRQQISFNSFATAPICKLQIWTDKLSQMPWVYGSYAPTKEIQACLNKTAIVSNYNFQSQNLYNLSFVTSRELHSQPDHKLILSSLSQVPWFGLDVKFHGQLIPQTWDTIQLLIFDHFQYSIRLHHPESLAFKFDLQQSGFPALRKTARCPHSNPTIFLICCNNEVLNGTFDRTIFKLSRLRKF